MISRFYLDPLLADVAAIHQRGSGEVCGRSANLYAYTRNGPRILEIHAASLSSPLAACAAGAFGGCILSISTTLAVSIWNFTQRGH
jgi:hypothetical protein